MEFSEVVFVFITYMIDYQERKLKKTTYIKLERKLRAVGGVYKKHQHEPH